MSSESPCEQTGPVRDVQKLDDATVVTLQGEIDMYRSPQLRQALVDVIGEKSASVVIDASDVPHMDSSGVATLVEALQQVKRYKGRLVLVGLQQRVRSVFEIAKLTDLFEIKSSVEEALRDGR